ncbi:hypothetical protein D9601_00865 [Sphingomonas sp. MA1305]|uniref:hypothetical protein n=1 Tax=unclassified Sphingomonas TaxID=196159 RepID=UPI0018DF26AA|nr:hypothetical protein [Sphingomonas sp. MA1305]MBI0473914.1 hypothetical protein [Sphingomonas sp. MA1305]
MILLALALQAAAPAVPQTKADGSQSWSILTKPPCGAKDEKGDIVVCANGEKLPELPDTEPSASGRGANPDLSPKQALALQATPCGARMAGCTVGFGPPIVPMVAALAKAAKSAFAKKPDKTGRVAIPLDDPTGPLPPLQP